MTALSAVAALDIFVVVTAESLCPLVPPVEIDLITDPAALLALVLIVTSVSLALTVELPTLAILPSVIVIAVIYDPTDVVAVDESKPAILPSVYALLSETALLISVTVLPLKPLIFWVSSVLRSAISSSVYPLLSETALLISVTVLPLH